MKPTEASSRSEKKKFLKAQAYELRQHFGPEILDTLNITPQESPLDEGKARIFNILRDASEFFAQRAIVGDLKYITLKQGGKQVQKLQFHAKYGLDMKIENLNSFLDFCAIHNFIPMLDRIFIEDQDISNIKEVYTLFDLAMFNQNLLVANILSNEILKLESQYQAPSGEILDTIKAISLYTTSTYQYLVGQKLEKIKNDGVLSENIFAEIALNLESQIREKLGIISSYIKLESHQADTRKKTDMVFLLKKTKDQNYISAPVQFTTSANGGLEKKEKDLEKYLLESLNKGIRLPHTFLLLAVNGKFKESFSETSMIPNNKKNDKENFSEHSSSKVLLQEYKERLASPQQREKNLGNRFPFFSHTIDKSIIQPAEVMYIALHLLHQQHNFRYTEQKKYLDACKKKGKLARDNKSSINEINLSDIRISEVEVLPISSTHPDSKQILKHKYQICYPNAKTPVGSIIIYAPISG